MGYAVKTFLRGDYTEEEGTNLPDIMDIVMSEKYFSCMISLFWVKSLVFFLT